MADTLLILGYQVLYAAGLLVLISLGLAVIFGMMKVINLAHGEFIMLGALFCAQAAGAGLPLTLAIPLAALGVGLVGILCERLIVRFLYGRMLDTLLATWGLSLLIVGAVTTLVGPEAASTPQGLGNLVVGGFAISLYSLVLVAIAAGLLAALHLLWHRTRAGLVVRIAMQNPTMAQTFGIDIARVYMLTFGLGALLAGLAGALLVPLFGFSPTMGVFYVAKAFVTVIVGGPAPLAGTLTGAGLFGAVDGTVAYLTSSVLGEIAVLLVAVVLLRLLPRGITGGRREGL